jgi:short-subunit dehydrogenase
MQNALDLKSRWVWVTGASSGLGREIARQLALEHRAHVVISARRRERLEELRAELMGQGATRVDIVCADLSQPETYEATWKEVAQGRRIDVAVLNAGVTYFGLDLDLDPLAFQSMLNTNIAANLYFGRTMAREAIAQSRPVSLFFVSSLTAENPFPYQAAYSASKAFLTQWALALRQELEKTPVSIGVFAPGGIETEMLEKSGLRQQFQPGHLGLMPVRQCAKLAIDALRAGEAYCVPGPLNRAAALAFKLLPRGLVIPRTASIYRGGLPK